MRRIETPTPTRAPGAGPRDTGLLPGFASGASHRRPAARAQAPSSREPLGDERPTAADPAPMRVAAV